MVHPEVSRFIREVRVAFQDDTEKYDQFCKLFVDLVFRRIHLNVFLAELKSLFEDHKYYLFWAFIKLLPKEHRPSDRFFKTVRYALKDDYGDFIQVMEDYCKSNIDERCFVARVEALLRGRAYLLGEMNTVLPSRFHVAIPRWDELPFDVLDVISRKLDFDELFQFSRVCMNWRVVHKSIDKSKFLTSQEPLLLEFSYSLIKVLCSFTSLPNPKVYPLNNIMRNMLRYFHDFFFPIYVTCSSGYFIFIQDHSSFLLINPFTRIKKKVICPSTFKFKYKSRYKYRALLAFDKCSEEFVLVFLFKSSTTLHVYQSRNNGWVTYSVEEEDDDIAIDNDISDFVAFNNIIYVVTEEARIGVLNLNSNKIEFLNMVNSLHLELELDYHRSPLYLVKCDEQLLLVRLNPFNPDITAGVGPPPERKVYKIDFSTMTYVKLETLGDIALFYVCFKSCQALSNPNRWGYESNSVYEVCSRNHPLFSHRHVCTKNPNCTVYNWDKKSEKYIVPPNPKTNGSIFDWCFRHLKYEVDYSL